MNNIVNYAIEANAGLIFFYGIYFLLLRNETDFRKQRIFLLVGAICALVAPLVEIDLITAEPIIRANMNNIAVLLPGFVVGESQSVFTISNILVAIYLLVAITAAVPMFMQALKMYRSIRLAEGWHHDNYFIIESKSNAPSWSFFRLIFIGQSDQLTPEEKDLIIRHEMLHGRLLHSIDILLFTLLCLAFWFNPLVWVYRKTIARIHEFEVDTLVTNGNNSADYGMLLAKTALSANGFLLPHYFNQSFILKRINMLNMLKSRISNWKLTVLTTMIIVYFVAVVFTDIQAQTPVQSNGTPARIKQDFENLKAKYPGNTFELVEVTTKPGFSHAQEGNGIVTVFSDTDAKRMWIVTQKADPNRTVYDQVDKNAEPVGGLNTIYDMLAKNMVYPQQARTMGVSGTVFVEFVVTEDGRPTDFRVIKGIGAGCDDEALRVATKMSAWKPAELDGKPVAAKLVLPISFKMI